MSKFNFSKLKKQAQTPQAVGQGQMSGQTGTMTSNTGQNYDPSQQLTSGMFLSDIWMDPNKMNQATGKPVYLTDISKPLIFLGNNNGMPSFGIDQQYLSFLKTASDKKMTKKAGVLAEIEQVKDDLLERLIDIGRKSGHVDKGEEENWAIENARKIILSLPGFDENDADLVTDQVFEELKKTPPVLDAGFQEFYPEDDYEDERFGARNNMLKSAIKKISEVKNIDINNLEAFEGDKDTIIVAELNSDRVFKIAKKILAQTDTVSLPDEPLERQEPQPRVDNFKDTISLPESNSNPEEGLISEIINNIEHAVSGVDENDVEQRKSIAKGIINEGIERFKTEMMPSLIKNFRDKIMSKLVDNGIIILAKKNNKLVEAKSELDKKFDRCVDDVKAKDGKGAKNPYAICMVSTGKGKKQKDKKASNNPFIKNN